MQRCATVKTELLRTTCLYLAHLDADPLTINHSWRIVACKRREIYKNAVDIYK